jgi:hypothetical protein
VKDIQLSHLGVNLKVRDFGRSKAFYDAFGFPILFEFGPQAEEQSKFRGLFYQVGDTLVEISEGHMAVKPEVFERPIQNAKVSLMVYVESLIPVLDICETHEFDIRVPPREFPWGQIGVIVKDPDGFVIAFLSEVSEEERRQVQARTDLPLTRSTPDYSDDHVQAVQKRAGT